jgi:S1-C subfamily serine protease
MTTQGDWTTGFADAVSAAEASVVNVRGHACRGGSGTVFRDDGLVLASAHATGDGEELSVTLAGGESNAAELVGREPALDLALLRVSGAKLKPLAFRSHDALRVGQWTLALGRPGEAIRASARIVGVLSHEIRTPLGAKLDAYVETDRGFPRGFAGGPLIDAEGHALGINSSAILRGADLTVPLVTIERVVEQLLAHGKVRRGYLGVAIQPVRVPQALRDQAQRERGLLVIGVQPGSPAAEAGLLLGDTLVDLNGAQVRDPRELAAVLQDKVDVEVSARIIRAGALQSVNLKPRERS